MLYFILFLKRAARSWKKRLSKSNQERDETATAQHPLGLTSCNASLLHLPCRCLSTVRNGLFVPLIGEIFWRQELELGDTEPFAGAAVLSPWDVMGLHAQVQSRRVALYAMGSCRACTIIDQLPSQPSDPGL